ncbi:MAG: ImmA/IrrE family metallo-endopeptidase [Sphaerochaetaceae bacterium]|nr:ImmA/IrrE family metallo-endopeptidase [Sphaerochaetaceae bacterium]
MKSQLSESDVSIINDFINEKTNEIKKYSENIILKTDVFNILKGLATVFFFPLKDSNDGFHVVRVINDTEKNYVYINSIKPLAKQIFVAAHEIGHILNLDGYYCKKKAIESIDDEHVEKLMNRFAAILLMPEIQFKAKIKEKFLGEKFEFSKEEDILQLFRLIAFLMDAFSVPYKAVIIRFFELGFISHTIQDLLIAEENKELVVKLIEGCIVESGYTNYFKDQGNQKPLASGNSKIAEWLAEVEAKNLWPKTKIQNAREQLDIIAPSNAQEVFDAFKPDVNKKD